MLKLVATLAVALLALSSCAREERSRTASQSAPRASSAAASTAAARHRKARSEPRGHRGAARHRGRDPAVRDRDGRGHGRRAREGRRSGGPRAAGPGQPGRRALLRAPGDPVGPRALAVRVREPGRGADRTRRSRSRFDRLIPGRRFALNRSTLMTVTPRQGARRRATRPGRRASSSRPCRRRCRKGTRKNESVTQEDWEGSRRPPGDERRDERAGVEPPRGTLHHEEPQDRRHRLLHVPQLRERPERLRHDHRQLPAAAGRLRWARTTSPWTKTRSTTSTWTTTATPGRT